jgi:putative ABC transport system ATP-binding protein
MSLFETRNLCKYFRQGSKTEVRALEDISLIISKGSFLVLKGPSGSGKTTLMAVLAALERPTRGRLIFEGRDLTGLADVELARFRRRTGFIFQNFSLIPSLSVLENITYPLIPRSIQRKERQRRARALLEGLGMADKSAALPGELSGGEQQRAALARALAGSPEILFADEPTSNLDEQTSEVLISLLKEFHGDGKTVIVSSHDARLVSLATTIFELGSGRLKMPCPRERI